MEPMNTSATSSRPSGTPPQIPEPPVIPPTDQPPGRNGVPDRSHQVSGLSAGFIVLSVLGLMFFACVVGITGYFRLSSETTSLRSSIMNSVPGEWHKTIALRVGWMTTALVRTGSRFFNMPPEPRAALDALHGAEVGVYKLQDEPGRIDSRAIFASADKRMKSRGWDRIVGVCSEYELVAVYFPHGKVSLSSVECCVLVLQGRDLVVASVKGNLEPLLKLADTRGDLSQLRRHLHAGI